MRAIIYKKYHTQFYSEAAVRAPFCHYYLGKIVPGEGREMGSLIALGLVNLKPYGPLEA